MHVTNRDVNKGYVGAMHYCKALQWGWRLDLGSLNPAPRFAHQLLLLHWLVVAKFMCGAGVAPFGRPGLGRGVPSLGFRENFGLYGNIAIRKRIYVI